MTPISGFPYDIVLFDVDGTLLDSNGAHAASWAEALRAHQIDAPVVEVRRLVGMGGDKLLPAIAGIAAESEAGRAITRRKKEIFAELLPALHATRGARWLVEFLVAGGVPIAIATSADAEETRALLRQAGVDDLIPLRASKDDAGGSKPEPDIVRAALEKAGGGFTAPVLVGDTPYDVEAASRAGIRSIALRCGGFWPDHDLAGAIELHDDPSGLLRSWRESDPGAEATDVGSKRT